jgi:polysaccharide export outer membrane protein
VPASTPPVNAPNQPPLPAGYVIGPDDVLQVVFWKDRDMSAEVTVRPDGMISLPLLNDVRAAGLTPEELRVSVNDLAKRLVEDPNVTIVVRTINSRKVFITGQVVHPAAYPLNDRITVMQLIALAGGLTEFADGKHITILRPESGGVVRPAGQPVSFPFNYDEVKRGRNLKQNIELKPGDTVIVP